MAVLVVVAHPLPDSFTHEIARAFQAGLDGAGVGQSVMDLYAEEFDPVLRAREVRGPVGAPAAAVTRAHAQLAEATALALVYPVWWSAPPAILLGWLQRVLIEGFAYRYEDRARGLLRLPVQLILNAGTQDRSLQGAYSEPILSALRYCGCGPIECHINWGIYPGAPKSRTDAARSEARSAGARLGQRLSKRAEF